MTRPGAASLARRDLLAAAAAAALLPVAGCTRPETSSPRRPASAAGPAPLDHTALAQAVRSGDRAAYVAAAGHGRVYDALVACQPSAYRIVGAGEGLRECMTLRLRDGGRVTFVSSLSAFGTGDAFWRTWGGDVTRTDGVVASVVTAGDGGGGWSRALDEAASKAARLIGTPAGAFAALVAPTTSSFTSLTGFASGVGIVAACVTSLTQRSVPVIVVAPGLDHDGEVAASVLAHELAHLLLTPRAGVDRCPPWLAEGMAEWVAVNATGTQVAALRAARRSAAGSVGLPAAADFTSVDAVTRESAYLRGYLAVDGLVAHWGVAGLLRRYRGWSRTGNVGGRTRRLAVRGLRARLRR